MMKTQTNCSVGKYGILHLDYIKAHRKETYTTLMMEGRLNEYLHRVDTNARETVSRLVREYAKKRDIDERLKASDPLRWVQEMNNCKASAEEAVLKEMIYV